ncbi:MAG: hypothetical protein KC503_00950 [Myxococcales bacterium]|nr:hypothetical protein [Myxococcales bacterium]
MRKRSKGPTKPCTPVALIAACAAMLIGLAAVACGDGGNATGPGSIGEVCRGLKASVEGEGGEGGGEGSGSGAEGGSGSSSSTAPCNAGLVCSGGYCVSGAGSGSGGSGGSGGGGGGGAGSCTTTSGKQIADGEVFCDSSALYQCLSGTKDLIKNCRRCKYIGAGTGSEYDTHCKSTEGATWPSNKIFGGPGCYFGYSRICAG